MLNQYLYIFLICTGVSFLTTPLIRKISSKKAFLDKPTQRKVHRKDIPTLGGLAIYLSFVIGIVFFYDIIGISGRSFIIGLLFSTFFIIILGVYDDVKKVKALSKLIGQIFIASMLYYYGFRIEEISIPFFENISLGYASFFITVVWIVAIINAINLLDGLDGLACGITAIVAIFLFIASLLDGNFTLCFLTAALAGSCLGFLPYNFYPASIFMGDTGSMFLGLILSLAAIESYQKSATFITILIPIIALGVPLIDTSLSILRRLIKRKPLFKPDKEHIHHRMFMEEKSQVKVVLNLYLVTFFFGLIALGFRGIRGLYVLVALMLFSFVTFRWVKSSGFLEVSQE